MTPASRATQVHEYRCTGCGLRVRGRLMPDGRVRPSNSIAPSDEVHDCLCIDCSERNRCSECGRIAAVRLTPSGPLLCMVCAEADQ